MKNLRHCHFNITMIHANYNSIFISGPSKNIFRTFFLLLKFGQSNIRPCIPFNCIKLKPNFIRILWVKYNYCIFQLLNLEFFFLFQSMQKFGHQWFGRHAPWGLPNCNSLNLHITIMIHIIYNCISIIGSSESELYIF